MTYSPAKAASNKKSDAKYAQILLKPYKDVAQDIRNAAAEAGQSLQGYILGAVADRMGRDSGGQPQTVVDLPPDVLASVRQTADASGISVDQWIIEAIRDKL